MANGPTYGGTSPGIYIRDTDNSTAAPNNVTVPINGITGITWTGDDTYVSLGRTLDYQSITVGGSFITPVAAHITEVDGELVVEAADADPAKRVNLTQMAKQIEQIHKMLSDLAPALVEIATVQKRQASRVKVDIDE